MAKNRQLYKAPIKKAYVAKLSFSRGVKRHDIEAMTLQKDALFYKDFLRRYVSIDYGRPLPTEEEAFAYCRNRTIGGLDNIDKASRVYTDYTNMRKAEVVTDEQLKQLIKIAHKKRR